LVGFNIVSGSLGLRLALKVPRLNSDARKSETKEFGLGLAMYKRRYVLEGFYGSYHGLVDREKEKYGSGLLSDPEDYIRRDIRVQTGRLSFIHIRKPDLYSYRASHYFNERMIRSGGSTMFRGRYNYFSAGADSAFVPGSGDSLVDHARMDQWRVHSFGAGVGYAYSLVLGSYFFIDAGLLFGMDVQWQSYGFNDGDQLKRTVYNPMFDFHFASGWNEDRFYVIFRVAYDLNNLSISSAEITTTLLTPSLSVGIRLDPPPEWQKVKEEFNFE
jgi:hypothetical protein